jgi:hypothetical protein
VPAGLGALCHDHVRPERLGLPGFGKRSDLQDQSPAGSADFGNERRRIAKGQKDRIGAVFQDQVEELGTAGETPGDEAGADLLVAGDVELLGNPLGTSIAGLGIAVAAADTSGSAMNCFRRTPWK